MRNLIISLDDGDDVATCTVQGEITHRTYRELVDIANQLAVKSPPPGQLILDLNGVDHVDSVGLGAFVRVFMTLKKAGCQLVLTGVSQNIRDGLALTKLDQLLNID